MFELAAVSSLKINSVTHCSMHPINHRGCPGLFNQKFRYFVRLHAAWYKPEIRIVKILKEF